MAGGIVGRNVGVNKSTPARSEVEAVVLFAISLHMRDYMWKTYWRDLNIVQYSRRMFIEVGDGNVKSSKIVCILVLGSFNAGDYGLCTGVGSYNMERLDEIYQN